MGERYFCVPGIHMEKTGQKLAAVIEESGLSDKQIGELMGLSVQAVNKWRHARNLPDIENLFILCQILHVKMDDILIPKIHITYAIKTADLPQPMLDRMKAYCCCLVSVHSAPEHHAVPVRMTYER